MDETPAQTEQQSQEETEVPESQVTTISPSEAAGQHDTSEDSLVPPGGMAYVPGQPAEAPEQQVERLDAYLTDQFPHEVGRTNYQVPETPVGTAIRLLDGMHAQVAMSDPTARCSEQFCNKPAQHRDAHGWIHFG
jgi:hypothetical protein